MVSLGLSFRTYIRILVIRGLATASLMAPLIGFGDTALAIAPLRLESSTYFPDSAPIFASVSDLDGDGRGDFAQQASNGLRILSSATGLPLRFYQGESGLGDTFGRSFEALPDSDGDGRKEYMIGTGVVYGLSSQTPSGGVMGSPPLFRHVFSGTQLALSGNVAAMSSVSESRIQLIDAATGAVRARLVDSLANIGLGMAMAGIGDINDNGFPDFALANPNMIHGQPTFRLGTIYIVDGSTTTNDWTEISQLGFPRLLATIIPTDNAAPGRHQSDGDRDLLVDLGDPRPGNDVVERLIVAGSPGLVRGGGFSAYLLTKSPTQTFTSSQTAFYEVDESGARFARDIAGVGDVNNDGVSDLAIMEPSYTPQSTQVGRVLIVDGAGLLDGYSTADIIQEIRGTPERALGRYLRFLGDYDGDGANELLLPSLEPNGVVFAADVYTIQSLRGRAEFSEPALGAGTYVPSAAGRELGFQTNSQPNAGANPLAAVSETSPGATRVLSHRSMNATTTFSPIDVRDWSNVNVTLSIQVADTGYEAGDFLRIYITDGSQTVDLLSATGVNGENNDPLDILGGQGFLPYSANIPAGWQFARLVIQSSSNSTAGSERYDFDDVAFYATPRVVPEPNLFALAASALVSLAIRRRSVARI